VADPEDYDVVACIGAPFAIGSFEEAVRWVLGALKPSSVLAAGDVFLRVPLPEEAAEREGVAVGDFRTLEQSAAVLEGHGLAIDGLSLLSSGVWFADNTKEFFEYVHEDQLTQRHDRFRRQGRIYADDPEGYGS
jgi:hypothetical protein